jgi:hypothetical protein
MSPFDISGISPQEVQVVLSSLAVSLPFALMAFTRSGGVI